MKWTELVAGQDYKMKLSFGVNSGLLVRQLCDVIMM